MTRSHCWGLYQGMAIDFLTQTFQDAVRIAQRLGAKYLWINSLCIFQDSLEDWQREAPTMSEVYQGSLCNIAASASKSGLE